MFFSKKKIDDSKMVLQRTILEFYDDFLENCLIIFFLLKKKEDPKTIFYWTVLEFFKKNLIMICYVGNDNYLDFLLLIQVVKVENKSSKFH